MRLPKNKPALANSREAFDYALTLLNYRDYSVGEMQEKLKKREAADEDAKAAIDKLLDYGLLDEKRYAGRVYDNWLAKKHYGRASLKQALQKRSIAAELAEEITSAVTEETELERCAAAADVYLKRKNPRDAKEALKVKAGLGRFLYARGFSINIITKIMAEKTEYFTDINSDY